MVVVNPSDRMTGTTNVRELDHLLDFVLRSPNLPGSSIARIQETGNSIRVRVATTDTTPDQAIFHVLAERFEPIGVGPTRPGFKPEPILHLKKPDGGVAIRDDIVEKQVDEESSGSLRRGVMFHPASTAEAGDPKRYDHAEVVLVTSTTGSVSTQPYYEVRLHKLNGQIEATEREVVAWVANQMHRMLELGNRGEEDTR